MHIPSRVVTWTACYLSGRLDWSCQAIMLENIHTLRYPLAHMKQARHVWREPLVRFVGAHSKGLRSIGEPMRPNLSRPTIRNDSVAWVLETQSSPGPSSS